MLNINVRNITYIKICFKYINKQKFYFRLIFHRNTFIEEDVFIMNIY